MYNNIGFTEMVTIEINPCNDEDNNSIGHPTKITECALGSKWHGEREQLISSGPANFRSSCQRFDSTPF